jgi:hypothetical protein
MKKLLYVILLLLVAACTKNTPVQKEPSCDPQISYSGKVKAVFVNNCTAAGCHDGNDLPSLADYLVAKDASGEIKTAVQNGVMPKDKTLSSADKAAIICWIDSGSKNN